jgi:hypothetical protein
MKRIMTGYAVAFNHRHERSGHLFQNRYKSIVCEESPYLLELVRYIHLNPYRAKIVPSFPALAAFPYTGHPVLIGKMKRSWQNRDDVLALFSKTPSLAVGRYMNFLKDGLEQGHRPDLMGGGLIRSQGGLRAVMGTRPSDREAYDSRILGSGDFVNEVLKTAEAHDDVELDLKQRGIRLEHVARRIADEEGISEESLCQRGRTDALSRAKARLIHLGVEYFSRTNREMAELTRMSDVSASRARTRAAALASRQDIVQWLKLIS